MFGVCVASLRRFCWVLRCCLWYLRRSIWYLVFDVNESISFAAFPSVYLSFDTMYLGWCVSYLEWEPCTIWKPIVLANNLSFFTMNVFGDCKFGNNLETCGAGKSFEASPQAGRHTVSPGSYQPLIKFTFFYLYIQIYI